MSVIGVVVGKVPDMSKWSFKIEEAPAKNTPLDEAYERALARIKANPGPSPISEEEMRIMRAVEDKYGDGL